MTSAGALQRFPRGLLLATLAGTPLVMVPGSLWDAFNLPKLALLGICVSLAGAIRLIDLAMSPRPLRASGLVLPATILCTALGVSWLLSPYRAWSWLGQYTSYQGLLPYLLVVAFGLLLADAFADDPKPIAVAIVTGCSLAAAYALVQRAGIDPVDWDVYGVILEGSSSLGNPNFAGSAFAIALPLALTLGAMARGSARYLGIGATLAIAAGLVATDSQVAWVAGLGGAAIAVGALLRNRWRSVHVAGLGVAALAAFTIVGAVGAALVSDEIASRSAPLQDRAWYWTAAGGSVAGSPLFGHGPDSFVLEGVGHRVVEEGVERGFAFTFDPHSAPLMFAASTGVLGLAAFLFLFIWTIRQTKRELSPLGWGFFAAAIAYFIQSLASTEQLSSRVLLWGSLAGLAVSAHMISTEPAPRSRRPPLVVTASIALAVIALGVVWVVSLVRADHEVFLGMRAEGGGDIVEAGLHLSRAQEIRDDAEYRKLLGRAYGRLALAERGSPQGEAFLDAADAAYSYTEEIPDPEAIAAHAGVVLATAQSEGEIERAGRLFEQAMRLDPVNPLIRVGVADSLIARGDPDAAHEVLEPLFYFFPRQPSFWGALALANAEAQDWPYARSYLASALELDPNDARALAAQAILRAAGEL